MFGTVPQGLDGLLLGAGSWRAAVVQFIDGKYLFDWSGLQTMAVMRGADAFCTELLFFFFLMTEK
jgi:hypothetical protein